MQHSSNDAHSPAAKVPRNKGKIIGARPPLQTKHVWSIRIKLQMDGKCASVSPILLFFDLLRADARCSLTIVAAPTRAVTNPSPARRSYAPVTVVRETVSRRASSRLGGSGSPGRN